MYRNRYNKIIGVNSFAINKDTYTVVDVLNITLSDEVAMLELLENFISAYNDDCIIFTAFNLI